jgi:hypothetical protein
VAAAEDRAVRALDVPYASVASVSSLLGFWCLFVNIFSSSDHRLFLF